MSIAIITNNLPFQKRFFEIEEFAYLYDEVISIHTLHNVNLLNFDTVIISERVDIQILKKYQSHFIQYIESGKRLIIFGEVLDYWFPTIDWQFSEVNFSWWVKENGDLPLQQENSTFPLFNYVTVKDMKWHYHGTFNPPAGAQSLLDTPDGRSIFYVDKKSFNGELIVTSLDPMFHIGLGFIDQSKPFLHGFAKWLRGEEK